MEIHHRFPYRTGEDTDPINECHTEMQIQTEIQKARK